MIIKRLRAKYLLAILFSCSLTACVPLEEQAQSSGTGTTAQAALRYEDYVYHESINSVQAYLATGDADQVLNPPVTSISQEFPLILEFDRLNAGPQRLLVKLVHCNANWTPSNLNETQYLNDFNEFFITDVQNSVNTRVPYVHYRFRVPRVKLSGNYLLVVQEEGGKLLLTQRLLVFQNTVVVTAKLGAPLGPGGREARQPVEFNVFYKDYPIVNPAVEVKAILRQNYRWDNAKTITKPTFVHDAQRRLEYVFFEPKDLFKGLSEFRAFDTRSLNFNGIGVQNINLQTNPITVDLEPGKSRQATVYSQEPDINGMRIFGNRQYGSGEVNGDYAVVDFELNAPAEAPGAVYITGALNNWKPGPESLMRYNSEEGKYSGRILLKQGYYNYYYTLKPNATAPTDESYFEGSHFATENIYDILIYYRPPGTRADLLIGYEELYFNRR
ncbi:type IX secretion system plug protein [Pontibacter sp. H249]|uniref:type IX secretion system plug protein n=1 Tax=Pontibacter sp. H249 TaxID=3133420 RepID=UPI0030BB5373